MTLMRNKMQSASRRRIKGALGLLALLVFVAFPKSGLAVSPRGAVSVLDISDLSTASYTRVIVNVSDKVEFSQGKLPNPERLYIDLKNAKIREGAKREFAMNGPVRAVRLGQFKAQTARVVFDLRHPNDEINATVSQTPHGLQVDILPELGIYSRSVAAASQLLSDNIPADRDNSSDSISRGGGVHSGPAFNDGVEAEKAGQWQEALKIYRAVVEKEPSRVDIWLRIADIEWSLGRTLEAIEALERAVQLSPGDHHLHFRLSQAYSVSNQPKKALAAIEKAVELAPDNVEYLRAMGQLANWNGRSELAVIAYKKLLAITPGGDIALRNLAESEMWSGDLDSAVKDFKAYTWKHPEDKEAWIEYSEAEGWRGDYHAGLVLLDKYRTLFGETVEYKKTKARLLAWAHRPTPALALTAGLLRDNPDDYEVNYSRTVAFRYANRPADMMESLQAIEKLRPESKETDDLRRFATVNIRSDIGAGFKMYADSDHLRIYSSQLKGSYFIKPETSLKAGIEYDYLHARKGSGLENIDGGTSENYYHGWIGIGQRLSPLLDFEGHLGGSFAEGEATILSYYLAVTLQIRDSLVVKLERDYDYFMVSPRTLSLRIKRGLNRVKMTWEPGLLYTVDANVGYNTLSDDNSYFEIVIGPRRSIVRSARFNLDIGINGSWLSFDKQLTHGYYSPELCQKYYLSQFGYWKINDENGIGLVISEGALKDNTMSGFRFSFDMNLEGTFGIYRDWMLKVNGGLSNNVRQATGAFSAYSVGMAITHRF